MEIKVFGPGCARCSQTEQLVKDVLAAKGLVASVIKVTDMKEMMMAGIMSTPAVSIDGVVKSTGKVPSREELASWLAGAAISDLNGAAAASTSVAPADSGECCSCGGKC